MTLNCLTLDVTLRTSLSESVVSQFVTALVEILGIQPTLFRIRPVRNGLVGHVQGGGYIHTQVHSGWLHTDIRVADDLPLDDIRVLLSSLQPQSIRMYLNGRRLQI